MLYSFETRRGKATLKREERDLAGDQEARLEAVQLTLKTLLEGDSGGVEGRDLTVEGRAPDGALRVVLQLRSAGEVRTGLAEDEAAQDWEGHPS